VLHHGTRRQRVDRLERPFGAHAQAGRSCFTALRFRSALEWTARALHYLGVPLWLLRRLS
jgi:hypothetical protein